LVKVDYASIPTIEAQADLAGKVIERPDRIRLMLKVNDGFVGQAAMVNSADAS
jgi:hypothetical protein